MNYAEAFDEYLARNPHLYALFVKFTLEAVRRGRRVLSAISVFERIRWETNDAASDGEFKINQNYAAHFARKFMSDNPQYAGLFRTRALRGS